MLRNLPLTFDYIQSKVRGRFRKILLLSQKMWTLKVRIVTEQWRNLSHPDSSWEWNKIYFIYFQFLTSLKGFDESKSYVCNLCISVAQRYSIHIHIHMFNIFFLCNTILLSDMMFVLLSNFNFVGMW